MNTFGDNRNLGRANRSSYKPSSPNKVNANAHTIHSAPTSLDHVKEMQQDLEMHRKARTEIGNQLSENTAQISALQAQIVQIRGRLGQLSDNKSTMPLEIAKQAGTAAVSTVSSLSENNLINEQQSANSSFEIDGDVAELRKSLREKEAELNNLVNDVRKVLNKKYDLENRAIRKLNSMLIEARDGEKKARTIAESTKNASEAASKATNSSINEQYVGKTATQRAKDMQKSSLLNKKKEADRLAKFNKAKNPTRAAKSAADAQKAARAAADLANASAKAKAVADGAAVAGKTAATVGEASAAAGEGVAAGASAGGTAAGVASGPYGWIALAVIFIIKFLTPPKLKKAKAGKDSSETLANEINTETKNSLKISDYAARWVTVLWPILMPVIFLLGVVIAFIGIVIIFAILFQLLSTEPNYTIKDAVIITEQEYHSQLITKAADYFDLSGDNINYTNNSLSWKNLLCLWYCMGTTQDDFILKDVDPSEVFDIVKDIEMSHEDYELMTQAFNTLNTILVYPETMALSSDVLIEEFTDESEIESRLEGLTEGQDYTYEEGIYYIRQTKTVCTVEVISKTALEYAESHGYDQDFITHIQNCLDAVNNDNPSSEPVFYELWQALRALTGIDVNVRDMVVQNAYAMWIMSGCKTGGYVPSDALNQYTNLNVTIYRESRNGNDIPFSFIYSAQNDDNQSSASIYGFEDQTETDVPVFLDPSNRHGLMCLNGNRSTVGEAITSLNPLKCEYYNWSAYSYHCCSLDYDPDRNFNAPWCAAFVTALGHNMRPNGCYFAPKDFIIDAEHPSWTAIKEETNFEAAQGSFMDVLSPLLEINIDPSSETLLTDIFTALGKINNVVNEFRNLMATYADDVFLNKMHISAHTDYYRINLSNHFSDTKYGLFNGTDHHHTFTPSDDDDDDYCPPSDDWIEEYYTLSPQDANGEPIGRDSTTGHEHGWYAPEMTYNSEVWITEDGVEFYHKIALCRLMIKMVLESPDTFLSDFYSFFTDNDYFIDVMNDSMSNDCALFSEIHEEQQNLFPNGYISCETQFREFFMTSSTVEGFAGNAVQELYTPQTGDLVLFDYPDDDGNRDGIVQHIGIIVWTGDNGSFATIEGNASDSIEMKLYYTSSASVHVVGHLKYGGDMES